MRFVSERAWMLVRISVRQKEQNVLPDFYGGGRCYPKREHPQMQEENTFEHFQPRVSLRFGGDFNSKSLCPKDITERIACTVLSALKTPLFNKFVADCFL